jgi:gas vesicle protein
MALSDIITRLLQPLIDKIKEALRPFSRIFGILGRFWEQLTHLRENIQRLVDTIKSEIDAWKNFKEDIAFRTRVINLPKAIEKTQEFVEIVRGAWDAIKDLWATLHEKLEPGGNPTEEAEEAIKDIEQSGFRDILQKFPKLLKGAEKVLGFVVIITDALESILDAIDDIQKIVEAITALREEVETANTIFLNSSNPRRTIRLADGTSMKIRVGNLH